MKGWMQGEPWPFWKGWEGFLGTGCLREQRRGVGEQRGTWWPQNGEGAHTLAGEEEREKEAQRERLGFSGAENHTTEGDSHGARRKGTWATTPPQEALDRGWGWWLLCHRRALGSFAEPQEGLFWHPLLWPNQVPHPCCNWHKPRPEMSPEQRAGRSEKPRAGRRMGFRATLGPEGILRPTVRLLVWAMELKCQQKHANNTHTQHTYCHTRHTYQARPEHPLPAPGSQRSLQEGGRSEDSRPSIYRRLGDGRHSPLTERWNWTFFSGKTRRRDGTGKDTA